MAIYKNKASQKIAVFAVDATGAAKTGDAANITAQISKDGGACAATNDVAPTELDATDAPGVYIFDTLQAETNADLIVLAADSSTSGVVIRPVIIYTEPEERVVASVTGGVGGNVTGSIGSLAVQAKADVNAECDTALTDAGVATVQDVVDGVLDELTSAHTGAGSVCKALIDVLEDTATTVPALIDAVPTAAENAAVEVEVDEAAASITIKRALQVILAAVAGKSTSGVGVRQYRNLADTKDRINATVSGGDRSVVTKSYD